MTNRITSILDRSPASIKRPKPLPPGTYLTVVRGLPRYDKSSKKQTEFVEFTLVIQKPADDVNPEDLAAMGGCIGKEIKATYYLTDDAVYRLKDFLEHCDFDVDSDEATLREMSEQAAGSQVWATIRHESSQDGKQIFARLRDTARVE
jgi:hypothetical protein